MSLRITNNEPTVLFDKDGNEYPVAYRPVTVEPAGQDVWEVSLTLICQDVEVTVSPLQLRRPLRKEIKNGPDSSLHV